MVNLPTIRGLSQFGGVDMYLQARAGQTRAELTAAQETLLDEAGKESVTHRYAPNSLPEAPQLQIAVDRVQAQTMGLSLSDVYSAINCSWRPTTSIRFSYGGRVKRVYIQADAPFRMGTDALTTSVHRPG